MCKLFREKLSILQVNSMAASVTWKAHQYSTLKKEALTWLKAWLCLSNQVVSKCFQVSRSQNEEHRSIWLSTILLGKSHLKETSNQSVRVMEQHIYLHQDSSPMTTSNSNSLITFPRTRDWETWKKAWPIEARVVWITRVNTFKCIRQIKIWPPWTVLLCLNLTQINRMNWLIVPVRRLTTTRASSR